VRLDHDQLVELAGLVAEHLRACEAPKPAALVSARELASLLGCDRSWVYAHQRELGRLRLGNGSKGRLRFDPERARQALATVAEPAPAATPRPRARRRASTTTAGSVLRSRPRSWA
jgi:hypothetical protein